MKRRSSYPADIHEREMVEQLPEYVCRGGSCVIDPYGHYATQPVWDEETIIYADLDMNLPAACKMEHDAVGHYARPDVLEPETLGSAKAILPRQASSSRLAQPDGMLRRTSFVLYISTTGSTENGV